MGLYREDEWKNSKGNESSLKFNEEETAAGDQPLVRAGKTTGLALHTKEPMAFVHGCTLVQNGSWLPHQLWALRAFSGVWELQIQAPNLFYISATVILLYLSC